MTSTLRIPQGTKGYPPKAMNVFIHFEKQPLLFQRPEFIISCDEAAQIESCFQAMESALRRGYYLAGFLSYEAGYAFEECLHEKRAYDFPLIHLGAYRAPQHRKFTPDVREQPGVLKDIRLNISQERYSSHIKAIRGHIAAGDVYQITYCIKMFFSFKGSAFSLYKELLRCQPVPYPAYLETDQFQILSCSPEMFVKKTGTHVVTKPMKGGR
jgi:para-aminobenzoate synthetase/4-amino-4-deoxychorismate lyase